MTTELCVRHSSGSYPVIVGSGILSKINHYLDRLGVQKDAAILLVTDQSVHALGHSTRILEACAAAGYAAHEVVIAPGDASKNLNTAETLYEALLDNGVRRNGLVIAVGGGVVGDLAGFAAATYLRGIRLLHVPTTLLAHDSSIGGKVAVNLSRGKNLVGAFYPPLAVLYDLDTLSTLPKREWVGGMAEVIKHGLIGNMDLLQQLEISPMLSLPSMDLAEKTICQAIAVKIKIIEEDERESGLRMLLNLGHTVGHAVEQLSHYEIHHGEGVAIGLHVESEIARLRNLVSVDERNRITKLLTSHQLPIFPPDLPFEAVVETLSLDKKHSMQGWTFVLPRGIGQAVITQGVTRDELLHAWRWVQEERAACQ